MKNWKNWMKNFWKNKKLMHRVLVGGIVAVCLVGMAAAGMRMRDLPGTLDGDRVNTAGKVADDQDGETAEQAEGLPEEETAAGEDSDIGLEGTADDGNDSDGSAADTSIANGSGTKAGGAMSDQNSSGQSASGQSQGGTGAQNGGGQSQTGGRLLPGKIPPEVPVLPVDRRDLRIPAAPPVRAQVPDREPRRPQRFPVPSRSDAIPSAETAF